MPSTIRLHRVLATSPQKVYRAFLEADALALVPRNSLAKNWEWKNLRSMNTSPSCENPACLLEQAFGTAAGRLEKDRLVVTAARACVSRDERYWMCIRPKLSRWPETFL